MCELKVGKDFAAGKNSIQPDATALMRAACPRAISQEAASYLGCHEDDPNAVHRAQYSVRCRGEALGLRRNRNPIV